MWQFARYISGPITSQVSDLTLDLPASFITLVIGFVTVKNKEVDAFSQLEVIVKAGGK